MRQLLKFRLDGFELHARDAADLAAQLNARLASRPRAYRALKLEVMSRLGRGPGVAGWLPFALVEDYRLEPEKVMRRARDWWREASHLIPQAYEEVQSG